MTVAQGIYKQLAYKKQSAKGTAASGSGGQLLRRETAVITKTKDTYTSNEITSHQQYTGDKHGIAKSQGTIQGLLSAGTYQAPLQSLLRKDFVATSALTGLALTIAGSGPYTLTRGSGDFLTGGIKIGDIVRITAGTYTGTARDINLLVTGVTATVLTVVVVNGSSLTTQGPISSSTVSVIGKKAWVPTTAHTNDYYTYEEWFADLSKSHTWPDVQHTRAEIALPSTGNATINLALLGLGQRTKGGSQVLTSPTAETTSEILAAVNGYLLIGGTNYVTVTSMNVIIDGQMNHGDAVIGSNYLTDIMKGDIKVSGTLSILYEADTLGDIFDAETTLSLVAVVTDNDDADADFVAITMSRVKLFSDDADDGKKQIIRTYNYTAEINGSGGTALANHQTIVSIQDSLAA
jgi:hypothetical protein